jgi:uncharacterized protein (TIGR03435 family)
MKPAHLFLCGVAMLTPAWGAPLEYEVASVKPSVAAGAGGGPFAGGGMPMLQMGARSGGRLSCKNLPLRPLILAAYGIQDYQLGPGPSWLMSDRFDIEAKPAAGTVPTDQQSREMLQALLEERFGLKIRHEIKNGPVYVLTIAKGGPKLGSQLKVSPDQTPVPVTQADMPGPLQGLGTLMSLGIAGGPNGLRPGGFGPGGPGDDGGPGGGGPGGGGPGGGRGGPGFPTDLPGTSMKDLERGMVFTGPGVFRAKAATIAELVRTVKGDLRKPVIDKTGLTALYDMDVNWTPAQMADMLDRLPPGTQLPAGMERTGDTISRVLQDRLGLKLDAATGPVDMILIDRVEKPTRN